MLLIVRNAPAYVDDHELSALNAVEEMYKKLDVMRQKWTEKGLPNVDFRIGINTARCLVGNIGAPNRLNYTALGDGVNVRVDNYLLSILDWCSVRGSK